MRVSQTTKGVNGKNPKDKAVLGLSVGRTIQRVTALPLAIRQQRPRKSLAYYPMKEYSMAINDTSIVVQGELTQFQFALILWLVFVVVVIGVIIYFYIARKYPKKEKATNPIFQAVAIWGILFLFYLLFAALGFRTQEEARNDVKWWLLLGIVLILFFTIQAYFYKKPIPSYKLWQHYVLPLVKQYWNAEPYKGKAYCRGMLFHRTIKLGESNELKGYLGKKSEGIDKVDVFLGQAKFANIFMFLMVMNKYTGEDLEAIAQPMLTMDIVKRLLGKEAVSSYEQFSSQYVGNTEQQQQTIPTS